MKPGRIVSDIDMDICGANNQFAVAALGELSRSAECQNVVLAPLSIITALSMIYLGARGNTATRMGKALHFADIEDVHSECKNLLKELVKNGDGAILLNVNKLFGEKTLTFLPAFVEDTDTLYNASMEQLDFLHDAEQSRQYINEWVTQQTKGKIQNLLPEQSISSNSVLVLLNTLYFAANWTKQFNQQKTSKAPFTLMTVEQEISPEKLTMWMSKTEMKMRNLAVYLPKFRIEKSFSLKSILSTMGMSEAFSQTKANFSGMTEQSNIFVSDVYHKTFLEVNEKGTEAASTTAAVMSARSFPGDEVKADHPFFFFIRQQKSNCILLCGKVYTP
ncbi:serpin B10-like isoform X3 [Pseudophryne corroboree]|uniref:serpin B10-like isoform X3 n=1 Tax=Pseudophryne corroboree TaxID=495146 RepID=UPI003081AF52